MSGINVMSRFPRKMLLWACSCLLVHLLVVASANSQAALSEEDYEVEVDGVHANTWSTENDEGSLLQLSMTSSSSQLQPMEVHQDMSDNFKLAESVATSEPKVTTAGEPLSLLTANDTAYLYETDPRSVTINSQGEPQMSFNTWVWAAINLSLVVITGVIVKCIYDAYVCRTSEVNEGESKSGERSPALDGDNAPSGMVDCRQAVGDVEGSLNEGDTHVTNSVRRGKALAGNERAMDVPKSVHSQIEVVAVQRAEEIALINNMDSCPWSYKAILECARKLQLALNEAGISEGDPVALLFEPSPALVVASIGVMLAGAVCVPINHDCPAGRRESMLNICEAKILLFGPKGIPIETGGHPENRVRSTATPTWELGPMCELLPQRQVRFALTQEKLGKGNLLPDGRELGGTAQIFFTSGSSAAPKGVVYNHYMLAYASWAYGKECAMDQATIGLLKTPPSWAAAIYELWPVLMSGGRLLIDDRCQRDIDALSKALAQGPIGSRPNTLMTSGQVLQILMSGPWQASPYLCSVTAESLRHVVNVGGALSMQVCADLTRLLGQDVSIHNVYGATESMCTAWTYSPTVDTKNAPAGWPQPGAQVCLVGENLRPVPEGQDGEICFGGKFLASGYLKDEELTNRRFIELDWWPGCRVYRTGDIGRWTQTPTGQVLEVLGRVDRQLNIRGVRVEPEALEALISGVLGVKSVAVVPAISKSAQGTIAYVEADVQEECLVADDVVTAVEEMCKKNLSKEICPLAVLKVDAMPRLEGGVSKIDLKRLEAMAAQDVEQTSVDVVDSLGMMLRTSVAHVANIDMLTMTRAFATILIINYHWWWLRYMKWGEIITLKESFAQNIGPLWIREMMIVLNQSRVAMIVFAVGSAMQDHAALGDRLSSKFKQDIFVVFIYCACHSPLPNIVRFVSQNVFGNTAWNVGVASQHRWYLIFVFATRMISHSVFTPLSQAVEKHTRSSKVALTVAGGMSAALMVGLNKLGLQPPDLCPSGRPQHVFARTVMHFLAAAMDETPGSCRLMNEWYWNETMILLVFYTVAWWFGNDIMYALRKVFVSPCTAMPGTLISCVGLAGMVATIGIMDANQPFTWYKFPRAWQLLLDSSLAFAVFIVMMFASSIQKFPGRSILLFMGKSSLAAYLLQSWVEGCKVSDKDECRVVICIENSCPSEDIWRSDTGLPQFVLFWILPTVFLLTLAPLFQELLVSSFKVFWFLLSQASRLFELGK